MYTDKFCLCFKFLFSFEEKEDIRRKLKVSDLQRDLTIVLLYYLVVSSRKLPSKTYLSDLDQLG